MASSPGEFSARFVPRRSDAGPRWKDPAFPHAFSWFDSPRYWSDHILSLREQLAVLREPPIEI